MSKIREFIRAAASLVVVVITCMFTGTACAAGEPEPQVTLSWLESCAGEQQPYFKIEVFSDRYRYRGGPGMRERGEIVRKLRRGESERLASDVKAYVADAGKRFEAITGKREKAETYCIELRWDAGKFAFGDVSSLVGGTTNAQANGELRSFEQIVGRAIDLKKLTCPAHAYDLTLNVFCGTPVIYFSFTDDEPCGYRHWVEVYDNGDLQYYSLHDNSVDERRKLSRGKLAALLKVARSLGPSDMVPQLVRENSTKPVVPRGTYSDPPTIEYFRTTLATIADIQWHKLSGPPRECFRGTRVNPKYPQGTLIVQMK